MRPGDPDHPLAVTEGGLVHTLVVAGGAAGFAAAFNAPLGGMLYMLEEIALPSGWSARATRGSFVAAASGKKKLVRVPCRDETPAVGGALVDEDATRTDAIISPQLQLPARVDLTRLSPIRPTPSCADREGSTAAGMERLERLV